MAKIRKTALLLVVIYCLLAPPGLASAAASVSSSPQTAVFSGGCFWGVDAVFKHVRGVMKVTAGYAGGSAATAHYEIVSTGMTGHAESVEILFDPAKISYRQLLEVFFTVAHDPTQLDRQGPDEGSQYRSAIFYANDEQKREAEAYIAELNKSGRFASPIVTQVVPLSHFYPAEESHQNFCSLHPNNPYVVINDLPKLKLLQHNYPELYKP